MHQQDDSLTDPQSQVLDKIITTSKTQAEGFLHFLAQDADKLFQQYDCQQQDDDDTKEIVQLPVKKARYYCNSDSQKSVASKKIWIFDSINMQNAEITRQEFDTISKTCTCTDPSKWDLIGKTTCSTIYMSKNELNIGNRCLFRYEYSLKGSALTFLRLLLDQSVRKTSDNMLENTILDYQMGTDFAYCIMSQTHGLRFPFSNREFVTSGTVVYDAKLKRYTLVRKPYLKIAPKQGFVQGTMFVATTLDELDNGTFVGRTVAYLDMSGYFPTTIMNRVLQYKAHTNFVVQELSTTAHVEKIEPRTLLATIADNQNKQLAV